MNRPRLIKTAATALACLALAACSHDELTDGTIQDLPEGKYPLQISSVTMSAESTAQTWGANAPQTRVAENTNDGKSSMWDWNGTEQIGVQLYENGETAAYTLNSDNTISATANPLYWNSTATTAVYAAWYPFADGTIDLSKQNTDGLAYVMKGTGSGDYKNGVSLSFTHQLAKIRVVLNGTKKDDVTDVKVLTYPACTFTHTAAQAVTGSGTPDYIPMKKTTYAATSYWEANVVPGCAITKVMVNSVECTLDNGGFIPTVAKLHLITLTVNAQE